MFKFLLSYESISITTPRAFIEAHSRARNQRRVNAPRRGHAFFIRAESERATTCWASEPHVELGNGPIRPANAGIDPCVLLCLQEVGYPEWNTTPTATHIPRAMDFKGVQDSRPRGQSSVSIHIPRPCICRHRPVYIVEVARIEMVDQEVRYPKWNTTSTATYLYLEIRYNG